MHTFDDKYAGQKNIKYVSILCVVKKVENDYLLNMLDKTIIQEKDDNVNIHKITKEL